MDRKMGTEAVVLRAEEERPRRGSSVQEQGRGCHRRCPRSIQSCSSYSLSYLQRVHECLRSPSCRGLVPDSLCWMQRGNRRSRRPSSPSPAPQRVCSKLSERNCLCLTVGAGDGGLYAHKQPPRPGRQPGKVRVAAGDTRRHGSR